MTKHYGSIYLSGGMEKSPDLGGKWRKECSEVLSSLGFCPVDITAMDVAYTKKHGHVYLSKDESTLLQNKSNVRHQFVYSDLRLLTDNCDAVIALFDEAFRLGSGSYAECQCAYDNNKPLFMVSTYPLSEIPTWLKSLTTKIFFSFDELYQYLKTLPQGILKTDKYGNHHSGAHYLCSLCGNPFEKTKHHFVSTVTPLYCRSCVDVVTKTREDHADRYEFMLEYLKDPVNTM